jgi:hypothetical protein
MLLIAHAKTGVCVCVCVCVCLCVQVRLQYADLGGCTDLCQLYSDGRAENATMRMENLGGPAQVGAQSIMGVMSTAPMLNGGTRFSSVMSASAGHYETTVREGGGSASNGVEGQPSSTVESARFLMRALVGGRIPELFARQH